MHSPLFLEVFWTANALENTRSIKEYLKEIFSTKEIEAFFILLQSFEEAISVFPELYPLSKKKSRRAVLSK